MGGERIVKACRGEATHVEGRGGLGIRRGGVRPAGGAVFPWRAIRRFVSACRKNRTMGTCLEKRPWCGVTMSNLAGVGPWCGVTMSISVEVGPWCGVTMSIPVEVGPWCGVTMSIPVEVGPWCGVTVSIPAEVGPWCAVTTCIPPLDRPWCAFAVPARGPGVASYRISGHISHAFTGAAPLAGVLPLPSNPISSGRNP